MSARRHLAALALLGLALGGCAEAQLSKTAAQNLSSGRGHPVYKVGNPYQIDGVTYYPAEDYNYDETGIASWYGPGFHEKFTANGDIFDQNDLTAAHRTLPMPCFVRVTNLDNGRSIVLRVNDRGPYARGRIIDVSRRGAQLLGYEAIGTARVRVQILANESRDLAAAMRSGQVVTAAAPVPAEPPPMAAPRETVASAPLAPPPQAPPPPAPPAQSTVQAQPVAPAATQPPVETAPVAVAALPDPTGQVRLVPPKRTSIYVQAGAFANRDNAVRLSNQLKSFGPSAVTPVTVGGQQLFRVRLGPLGSVEEGDRTLDLVVNAGHPEARLIVD